MGRNADREIVNMLTVRFNMRGEITESRKVGLVDPLQIWCYLCDPDAHEWRFKFKLEGSLKIHLTNMFEHFIPGDDASAVKERAEVLKEWQEFYTHGGKYRHVFDKPIPEPVSEEDHEENNKSIKIKDVQEWVERTGGMERRFEFFNCYFPTSKFFRKVAEPLLSMKCVGSMDAERAAKPLKHDIITQERNRLGNDKAEVLLRVQTNLKYLSKIHHPDWEKPKE